MMPRKGDEFTKDCIYSRDLQFLRTIFW